MHTTPAFRQAATSSHRAHYRESACSRRKLVMHSPDGRHIHDPDSQLQQVNAAAISVHAASEKLSTTNVFADCSTSCIHSETSSPRADVKQKASTACDTVLMVRPADQTTVNAPSTVTCGTKQVRTRLESAIFDPRGRTLLSVHLMLASELQIRPDMTLEKLKLELKLKLEPAVKRTSLPLPKDWYTEGEASTCTAYSPVLVHANIDGVDMKLDACVVVDVFT